MTLELDYILCPLTLTLHTLNHTFNQPYAFVYTVEAALYTPSPCRFVAEVEQRCRMALELEEASGRLTQAALGQADVVRHRDQLQRERDALEERCGALARVCAGISEPALVPPLHPCHACMRDRPGAPTCWSSKGFRVLGL